MKIKSLLGYMKLDCKLPDEILNKEINSYHVDSRNVDKDSVFFALKGERQNGEDFIEDAFSNGAIISFASKSCKIDDDRIIKVENTEKLLIDAAKEYIAEISPKIIAITGSVGKTTCKELIYQGLKSSFVVSKTKANQNTPIGISLSAFNFDKKSEYIIIEMGIGEYGEMEELINFLAPDIAVLTNLGQAHLEKFKSIEDLADEKLKISKLDKTKVFISNIDSEIISQKLKTKNLSSKKIISYGENPKADYRLIDFSIENSRNKINYQKNNNYYIAECNLLGKGNANNFLCALAIAEELGVDESEFLKSLYEIPKLDMRLEMIEKSGIKIISDCYNSSLSSLINAIDLLTKIKANRKFLVVGDILEASKNQEKYHSQISEKIPKEQFDMVIFTGKYMKFAFETYLGAKLYFKDKKEISTYLKDKLQKDDMVLFKASRAIALETVIKDIIGD